MATLELLRLNRLTLRQTGVFGEIILSPIPRDAEPADEPSGAV